MDRIRLTHLVSLWVNSISSTSTYTRPHTNSPASIILQSYYTLYQLGTQVSKHSYMDEIRLMKKAFRFVLQVAQPPSSAALSATFLQTIMLALIAADKMRLGTQAITCALLYGVARKEQAVLHNIKQAFGDDMADIIQDLIWLSDHHPEACYSRDTTAQGPIYTDCSNNHLLIILLNLAQQLQTLYVIEIWNVEKQMELLRQMENIYAPLVRQLDLKNLYLELADICFKVQNPIIYQSLIEQVQQHVQSPQGFLENFAKQIYTMLQSASITCSIKGRTKSIASIHNKIKNRGIAFEAINDFYAICIVFESREEDEFNNCWHIYNIIADRYRVKAPYLRDWISRPKDAYNSYQALHLTIQSDEGLLVEVQIRTTRMHQNAEYGDAAHWKYKNDYTKMSTTCSHIYWLERAKAYLSTCATQQHPCNIFIIASDIYDRCV